MVHMSVIMQMALLYMPESLIARLESAANKDVVGFKHNHMKLNPDKCHLLVCGHTHECIITNIGGTSVIESYQINLLGISIDRELTFENYLDGLCKTFENHLDGLCKTAGRKLNALSRQCEILPFYQRKSLLNAFFDSLFSYCRLVSMR